MLSDHPDLTKVFRKLVQDMGYPEHTFSYGNSPSQDPHTFNQIDSVSIKSYDLTASEIVDKLIKEFDLILSLHCKQIFPFKLVSRVKCINVHPGYNPINRGWFPQVFAIKNNLKFGATIHEMDEKIDNGLIIDRIVVPINKWETSLEVYNKVIFAELDLLSKNLNNILENNYSGFQPVERSNVFYKKDFKRLCVLDLNKVATFEEFIDHLRAVSHGKYRNAYFYDNDGNKIYIKIELEYA